MVILKKLGFFLSILYSNVRNLEITCRLVLKCSLIDLEVKENVEFDRTNKGTIISDK